MLLSLSVLLRGTSARFRFLFTKNTRYGILAARNFHGMMTWKLLDGIDIF